MNAPKLLESFAPLLLGLGVGLAALAGVALIGRAAAKKVGELAPLVNPSDNRNIVYDGLVGGVGRAVSGQQDWSLGAWLWELTHPGEVEREQSIRSAPGGAR